MAITVNTNVFSLSAQRNVSRTLSSLETAMQRLSSGLRINQAKDDAAGLAVASRMETQARGSDVAVRNIGDGQSLLQVADHTLRDVGDILQRMRELATQASTGTYADADRLLINKEYSGLLAEISDTISRGKFNGSAALSKLRVGVAVLAGANSTDAITVSASGTAADIATGLTATISTSAFGIEALGTISTALQRVAKGLAGIGAYESRLEKAMSSVMSVSEAQWSSRGRIMDADFAKETSRMTSAQVIQQAGVAALAQANQIPQMALGLLQ